MGSETTILQTLTGGTLIRGRPGLFMPADAYRLDQAWTAIQTMDGGFDMSFMGDVEGLTLTDSSGTKVAYLTIPEYESLKENLQSALAKQSELNTQIESLSSRVSNLSEQMSGLNNDGLQSEINSVRESVSDLQLQVSSANAIAQSAAQDVSEISTEFSEVRSAARSAAQDVSDVQAELAEIRAGALDLTAELENLRDQQKEYLRTGDYSTVDGSLIFYDGYGIDVLTVGGGWYEEETVASTVPATPTDD